MQPVVAAATAADHVTERAPRRRPVRTCIGCRSRDSDQVLLRVVAVVTSGADTDTDTEGHGSHGSRGSCASQATGDPADVPVTVVPDPRRRLPGRGAWVHPDPACVDLAVRRRAFGRALRVPGRIDPAPVGEYVAMRNRTDPHGPSQASARQ